MNQTELLSTPLIVALLAGCGAVEQLPAPGQDATDGGGGEPSCGGVDESCCGGEVCDDPGQYHELTCKEGICRSREWALWPMPNPPSTGLPNPQSYSLNGDLVTDNVTGLVWQRVSSPEQLSWQPARDYCRDLAVDGGGFRLPTRIELASIVDYTRDGEAIDAVVFEAHGTDFSMSHYWTSTPGVPGQASWSVSFYLGQVNLLGIDQPAWIRCVR